MSTNTSASRGIAPRRHVQVLGTRGIPGRHGGFESFAEDLAHYLIARGWEVTVYCQEAGGGPISEWLWEGVRLVRVPVRPAGALGTIVFDWHSTGHALAERGVALVLGYNTALFSLRYRWRGHPNVMNMDGIEWRRGKHGALARLWFFANEWIGCRVSDALVADHPVIAEHLARWRPTAPLHTIAYGSRRVDAADEALLAPFSLKANQYGIVIARPEPENSILEVVRAHAMSDTAVPLIVLGQYDRTVPYQRAVLDAAGSAVYFPGPVYERRVVDALRRHCRFYVHGHTVGGTNPSLVESLGAGCAVLAHDNPFNRWVAGRAACYFHDEASCADHFRTLSIDDAVLCDLRATAVRRHAEAFELEARLHEYEVLLLSMLARAA